MGSGRARISTAVRGAWTGQVDAMVETVLRRKQFIEERAGDSVSLRRGRDRVRWLLPLAVLALLSACASLTPQDTDAWRDSQRAKLKARAEARWKALIAGDYATAYEYLSPDHRVVVSLQQFREKFGGAITWRMAIAKDIKYDSPTVATVMVAVTYRYSGPRGGGDIEMGRLVAEKWLYSGGDWWYISAE